MYRESLASSEGEREEQLRRTYKNVMSYKTSAKQKQALPQDVAAVSIQFRFAGEPRTDIGIQPIQQHRQRVISVSQLVLL